MNNVHLFQSHKFREIWEYQVIWFDDNYIFFDVWSA